MTMIRAAGLLLARAWPAGVWGAVVLLAGCRSADPAGTAPPPAAFAVEQVRFQRSFTRIIPAATPGAADTIESYVELRDKFGDPIKAMGEFRFELFRYRPAFPDPRGARFEHDGLQILDLRGIEVNQQHWDSITRSYRLPLRLPQEARSLKRIVLQVTFSPDPQYRFLDVLVLERGR